VRVVLDTNVLVAALRSRNGASFEVLKLLRAGQLEVAISVPLVFQYESVLVRHARELALSKQEAIGLVDYFCQIAHKQEIHFLWRPALRDPSDESVLELAVAAECRYIVTHNVKDFTGADQFRVSIVTPGEFLKLIERKQ
jgi:putative PIN family toxin of toxin-antitoxin system